MRMSQESFPDSRIASLLERLEQHDQRKPAPPRSVGVKIMSDATPAAIAHNTHQLRIKSLGILTSEGEEFFSRGIKQDPTLFNNSWSGDPTRRYRVAKGDQSFSADITIGAALQPQAAHAIFNDRNKKLRSSGFTARALFSFPASHQGSRTTNKIIDDDPRDEAYRQRIHQLLELSTRALQDDNLSKTVLSFAPEAQEHWFRLQWEIEAEIRPSGRYFAFRDHANKFSDNAARVACILHVMEYGLEGEIALSTLCQAIDICAYCSDEFMRLFHEPPQEEVDTIKLGNWLHEKYRAGYRYIRKSFALTHGPIKPAVRLDIALNRLFSQQLIGILHCPSQTAAGRPSKPKTIIDLRPSLQPDHYAIQQVAYAY